MVLQARYTRLPRTRSRVLSIGSGLDILTCGQTGQTVTYTPQRRVETSLAATSMDMLAAERAAEWADLCAILRIDEHLVAMVAGVMIWRDQIDGERHWSWHALDQGESDRAPLGMPLAVWIQEMTGVDVPGGPTPEQCGGFDLMEIPF